jgi:hypothetical protein
VASRVFKGLYTIATTLVVVAGFGCHLHAEGIGKESGRQLLERCRIEQHEGNGGSDVSVSSDAEALLQSCEAFLDGFIWGHAWAAWRESRDMWFCLPEKSSGVQMVSAVVDYLESHPDRLEEDAHLLVFLALTAAYPCK